MTRAQPPGGALLRPDRVRDRVGDPVLVHGTAEVDDRDLLANRERYWRESLEKLLATKDMHPPRVMRGLFSWYYTRIYVKVRPERVFVWERGDHACCPPCSTRTSRRCAPAIPRSPNRRIPRPAAEPRRGTSASRSRGAPPDGGARVGRADGFPLSARVPVRARRIGTGSRSTPSPAELPLLEGRGCLTAHAHDPDFSWQENFQVRGDLVRDPDGWSLVLASADRGASEPPTRAWRPATGATSASRRGSGATPAPTGRGGRARRSPLARLAGIDQRRASPIASDASRGTDSSLTPTSDNRRGSPSRVVSSRTQSASAEPTAAPDPPRLCADELGDPAIAVGDPVVSGGVELDHDREVDRVRDAVRDPVPGAARVRERVRDPGRAEPRRDDRQVGRDEHLAARLLVGGVGHRALEAVTDHADRVQGVGVAERAPLVDVTPSIACVSASIPVAAAIGAGSVAVDSGSRIASRGASGKSRTKILISLPGSLTTATGLTSEPVPAVVGIAASGASGNGGPIPSAARGSA